MSIEPRPAAMANSEIDYTLGGVDLQAAMMKRLMPDTRRAVLACHSMHREIKDLSEPLTLLSWITIWIEQWGLRQDDAAKILREMTHPDWCMKHKYASELKTSLAQRAADCLKSRASQEAEIQRKRDLESVVESPEAAEKTRQLIAEAAKRFSV